MQLEILCFAHTTMQMFVSVQNAVAAFNFNWAVPECLSHGVASPQQEVMSNEDT